MPAPAEKVVLSDRFLKALKPDPNGKRIVVWDAVQRHLAVRVSAKAGKKSFYVVRRVKHATLPTWVLLGEHPVMPLADAREQAREALAAMERGQHPKKVEEARRQSAAEEARAVKTEEEASRFETIAREFEHKHVPTLSPSSQRMYRRYVHDLIAEFGPRPIGGIARRDIIKVVDAAKEKSGTPTAHGLFGTLRTLLNWAVARDLLVASPTTGIKIGKVIGVLEARDRALSDKELVPVWEGFSAAGQPFETIFRLLSLLGLRLNEVAGMRWSEVDLDRAELTIPAGRSKNKLSQVVPLPPLALKLIQAMPRFERGDQIFTTTFGEKPVCHPSLAKARVEAALIARGAEVRPWRIHDLRRTVRSNLSKLGVATEVAEAVLGHRPPRLIGTYDRYDRAAEKRDALERWERHLLGIAEQGPDKVVSIRTRALA